jgi:sulfate adenylyltransferase subunit 1
MDLVEYAEAVFNEIREKFEEFTRNMELRDHRFVPISALNGDNVVKPSEHMEWYNGGTLLDVLEHIPINRDYNLEDARFPVQHVIRPISGEFHDYRGYAGRVDGGIFKKGDKVIVLPEGHRSKIKSIDIHESSVEEAYPPMSVTLQLDDDLDISRGDMIVKDENIPHVSQDIDMMICWMNPKPMVLNGKYALKHTTRDVRCLIKEVHYKVNVNNLEKIDEKEIRMNDIARITIRTTKPLFFDSYSRNRRTGALVLIDEGTNETVGVGMIE